MTFFKTLLSGLSLATWLSFLAIAQEIPTTNPGSNPSTSWAERAFWETTDGKPVSDGWEFKDGTIALVQPGQGGNIVTQPLPSNFELSWTWKIEKNVNGGLKSLSENPRAFKCDVSARKV